MDEPLRPDVQGTEIAIVGMAGRFPGASSIDEYWRNLVNGVESIERFGRGSSDGEVRAASRLKDIDLFDADFFGFSPKEAELMDPQHRLFLECVHEALERAGYDPARYPGLVGVYAGMGANTYFRHALTSLDPDNAAMGLQLVIGNDKDYLSTMVSYKLNLRGPSLTVQTACSTSLVAVHLACQSLLDYECDMALAGGVSVRAPQPTAYRYYEGGILSPDGYCRTFDARAQGTVFGNGLGVVVLRRLEDALEDGDHIWAVIRGSAVNNDGASKVGYTAPALRGQMEVIEAALARARVEATSIQYIEAHGTGTPLGDPIEVRALTEVYRRKTDAIGYCGLGSVKTNIGHLDAAAGVAGLIKTTLALSNRMIPPTLHFSEPNPLLSLPTSPFYVVTEATPWESPQPRRAAVSSLGIGGTNAHVVLEEAPLVERQASSRARQVIVLSARSNDALDTATAQLAAHLKTHRSMDLADVAYTLQAGRKAFSHRRTAVCADIEDAIAALESSAPGGPRVLTAVHDGAAPSVAFMFPGGGAHHVNMAAGIYRTEPTFRKHVDECLDCLRGLVSYDLKAILYPSADCEAEASRQLQQTSVALPALFVTEYALAKLWIDWGVRPQAMLGHSLGEYVAACLAGVMSLADALALVVRRSQLLDRIVPGSMLSVPLSEQELRPLMTADLSVAAINAPSLCVVSGPNASVADLKRTLSAQGHDVRSLHIAVGAHSHLVEPILETFREFVATLTLRPPTIPFIANASGAWITPDEATSPQYWTDHLRRAVRFSDGINALLEDPSRVLLEVGPGRTLSTLARANASCRDRTVVTSLPHPFDPDPDIAVLAGALGHLWLAGSDVDWPAHHQSHRPHRVSLPTYPFERRRFWIGPDENRPDSGLVERARASIDDWVHVPAWKQSVPAFALPRRPVPPGGEWLVFADSCGVGERIARRLQARGDRVSTVAIGAEFVQTGDRTFTIDPRRPGDYDLLFRALGPDRAPHTIVHLWNLTEDGSARRPMCQPEDASTFEPLLFLAQAAHANGVTTFQLAVCANSLALVTPSDFVCPGKAPLLGACRVMPQEYAGVTSRWIDLQLRTAPVKLERMADLVVEELSCDSPVQAVAYRGRQRWVQTFDKVALRDDAAPRLRDGGVYLITGGFGGLGLILARHLAATVRARLVLTSRTALPSRDAWRDWLTAHDEVDDTSVAIRTIAELEASGTDVLTIAADVCDPRDVERMFADANRRFGHIDGVFHLAGVPGAGVMQLKTADAAAAVCAPKVRGARLVVDACGGRDVDFVVLFSSITAVTGGIGQSDYCAASAYMDAVAAAAARSGPPVVAIHWDAWQADRWQDAALTQFPEAREQFKRWRSRFGIRPEEGMAVLSRVLNSHLPRVIVSTQDVKTAMDAHDRALATTAARKSEASRGDAPRPRAVAYVAPSSTTETLVAAAWQHVLGVGAVGAHDNFFGLGGHSLLMLQVVARLRQDFGMDVPVRAVFDHPSVSELAAFIDERRAEPPAADAVEDDEELARVLAEVERLTPEQVRTQLDEIGPQLMTGGRA